MRRSWRNDTPALATLVVFLLVAVTMGAVFGSSDTGAPAPGPVVPAEAIDLGGPDADRDSYPDAIDLWDGNAMVRLEFTEVATPGGRPYLHIGTQDDHYRLGENRRLEWLHVVDPDPLGNTPGSPAWQENSLRTGLWQRSPSEPGWRPALGPNDTYHAAAPPVSVPWPLAFHLDVRDDQPQVTVTVELWDASRSPHVLRGEWELTVRPLIGTWSGPDGTAHLLGALGTLATPGGSIELRVQWVMDLELDTKQAIAERWAPTLHFHEGELFFPASGDGLVAFHGFWRPEPDLRTWHQGFNNGRDYYQMLISDLNGDGHIDHLDHHIMDELLRAAGVFAPTVYAHVTRATGDTVVVQYWFFYSYNFVLDDAGQGVPRLAHLGDREFVQLVFADVDEALDGDPSEVAFSQHFRGIRTPEPVMLAAPFHDDRFHVYVARGSHASYPVPGDDRLARPSFAGFADHFHGQGDIWHPDNYTLEVFADQEWYVAYKWGPQTRFSRLLGTSFQPLQAHSFLYPFHDPIVWMENLATVSQDQYHTLYNTPEALR